MFWSELCILNPGLVYKSCTDTSSITSYIWAYANLCSTLFTFASIWLLMRQRLSAGASVTNCKCSLSHTQDVVFTFPLSFFRGLSQISNWQWLPALIFQKKGAISFGARCGYQMQRCVKASSSNSPLTEGPLHACEGDGCIFSPLFPLGYFWRAIMRNVVTVFPAVIS